MRIVLAALPSVGLVLHRRRCTNWQKRLTTSSVNSAVVLQYSCHRSIPSAWLSTVSQHHHLPLLHAWPSTGLYHHHLIVIYTATPIWLSHPTERRAVPGLWRKGSKCMPWLGTCAQHRLVHGHSTFCSRPICFSPWSICVWFSCYLRLVLALALVHSYTAFCCMYAFVFCSWRLQGVIMLYASCS